MATKRRRLVVPSYVTVRIHLDDFAYGWINTMSTYEPADGTVQVMVFTGKSGGIALWPHRRVVARALFRDWRDPQRERAAFRKRARVVSYVVKLARQAEHVWLAQQRDAA